MDFQNQVRAVVICLFCQNRRENFVPVMALQNA